MRVLAADEHQLWLACRKLTVEENFPDVCTCYFSKPFARQSSCKDCEMCPGCEQHIKNKYWDDHAKECRALKDLQEVHNERQLTFSDTRTQPA